MSGRLVFSVRGLRAGYGTAEVLHGLDLDVGEGEAVAVLGPNGAGKTTLLRAIYGICNVMGGSIHMGEVDVVRLHDYDVTANGIGHVPQGRGLFPEMTVMENLTVGGVSLSSRSEVRERIDLVKGMFPILANRPTQVVGTMSGGEQQMVAIGRALMAKPRLLLLDEPSLGLAPIVVADIFEHLSSLTSSETGMAILLVEQRVQEALELCGRVYVLEGGVVVATGSAGEIGRDELLQEAFLGGGAISGDPAEGADTAGRAGVARGASVVERRGR